MRTVPNADWAFGPHSRLVSGFNKSQSGKKLPLRGSPAGKELSFHVLVVLPTKAFAGFAAAAMVVDSRLTYLPTYTLIAVLPLPKTSYAAPRRGVTSSQHGTQSCSGDANGGT